MKKTIFFSLLVGVSFLSCNKSGKAKFTTDKETYEQGETIFVTNQTDPPANFYIWNFDGNELIQGEPAYTIPNDREPGDLLISCMPTKNTNTRSSAKVGEKTVKVIQADNASLTIYKTGSGTPPLIEVTLLKGGVVQSTATIYEYYNSTPTPCGNGFKCANFNNLKAGTYQYEALWGGNFMSGSVNLADGFECKTIEVIF